MLKSIIRYYIPYIAVMFFTFLFLNSISILDKFKDIALEYFLLYTSLLFFKRISIKKCLWCLLLIILGAQLASLYTSGNFIIPLTLSNAGEFHAIGYSLLFKLFGIVTLYFLFSFFMCRQILKTEKFTYKGMMLLLLFIPFTNGPFLMLCKASYAYYQQVTFSPAYSYPEVAHKFLKVGIWGDTSNLVKVEKPNVIIIFTEGMSNNIIDAVNKKGLRVTPVLDSLFKQSMSFTNYYNHTAATFRGLRGQLTSGYQYKDGIGANNDGFFEISNDKVKATFDKRLISLPEILEKNGYKTMFLSSTEKNSTLNAMLKTLSFNSVYGMGDFEFYQNDRMTDRQTFLALQKLVEQNIENRFFIGVYPSGTHHGIDSPDEYYGNGKNAYYNKFYNFDHQLGVFIEFLRSKGLMEKTLLVITSDHSTFPTPEFNKSFGTSAKYFVDSIPLIITGAGVPQKTLDAGGVNSLALTPTILNLLDINNQPNFFLGCSLFDSKCTTRYKNISAIGNSFFVTNPSEYPEYNVQEIDQSEDIEMFYNISG